jgi:hypothetical protein
MHSETYLPRKAKLLKDFQRSIGRVRPALDGRYGDAEASVLVCKSYQEYEALIPTLPYLGEGNPMLNLFFFPSSRYLGIYRAFQARGLSLEEIGCLTYEMGQAEIQALPGLARRGLGVLWFSGWFRKRLQRRAVTSQERRYPGDYVIEYLEGDGQDFDYGIDYLQCASWELFRSQGAEQLAPYVCAIDRPASQLCGWGLRRTTTLAEGGQCCDARGGTPRFNGRT